MKQATTLKMEEKYFFEITMDFCLQGFIFKKTELFITAAVITTNRTIFSEA
jgi:hypothetical protein